MRTSTITAALAAAVIASTATPALAQSSAEIMKGMGLESTRTIDGDIAYPATSDEYDALGKNAVLMVDASSVVASELPLRSVYAVVNGVRIPLRRIMLGDKRYNEEEQHTRQVSFHLVPIQVLKNKVALQADFGGSRTGFGFMSFGKGEAVSGAPAFVRLDEYDAPGEPDPDATVAMIRREYPDRFADAP